MKTERIFNGRNVMVLLLVAVWLALATMPALAWFDEGTAGEPAQACRAGGGTAAPVIRCVGETAPGQAALSPPLLQPQVAKAELMLEKYWPSPETLAKYPANQ